MYEGYFAFGGNEVGNSTRSATYANRSGCPTPWRLLEFCESLAIAEEHEEYETPVSAPWFDPDDPFATGQFLGLYVQSIRGLSDSTREANVTQLSGPGAKISGYRHGSRQIRVTAWLSALGEEALEAGMTWLRNVLEPNACGIHGGACQTSDFSFFVTCPPEKLEAETDEEYRERVEPLRRYLHSVRCVSGPNVVREYSSDGFEGRLVEFIFVAEVPFVYGAPKMIEVPPITPSVIQDVPYNLIPYPSAEVTEGPAVIVARNISENPSVETNNTGWYEVADGTIILLANIVDARSNDIAASGLWSERAIWTAPGASALAGWFGAEQNIELGSFPAGTRYSVNMWASVVVQAGAPVLGDLEIHALWHSGGAPIRTDLIGVIGTGAVAGAKSQKSILPPVGATHVKLRARINVTSRPAGTIIRLYADALALTVP